MVNAGADYGIAVRTRATANTNYAYQQALGGVAAPYWLKLARSGTTITASYSTDGVTYTTAYTDTVSLTGTFYAGLAVTSFQLDAAQHVDVQQRERHADRHCADGAQSREHPRLMPLRSSDTTSIEPQRPANPWRLLGLFSYRNRSHR